MKILNFSNVLRSLIEAPESFASERLKQIAAMKKASSGGVTVAPSPVKSTFKASAPKISSPVKKTGSLISKKTIGVNNPKMSKIGAVKSKLASNKLAKETAKTGVKSVSKVAPKIASPVAKTASAGKVSYGGKTLYTAKTAAPTTKAIAAGSSSKAAAAKAGLSAGKIAGIAGAHLATTALVAKKALEKPSKRLNRLQGKKELTDYKTDRKVNKMMDKGKSATKIAKVQAKGEKKSKILQAKADFDQHLVDRGDKTSGAARGTAIGMALGSAPGALIGRAIGKVAENPHTKLARLKMKDSLLQRQRRITKVRGRTTKALPLTSVLFHLYLSSTFLFKRQSYL